MEVMTDYQLKVILQLIIDKLNNCKTIEEYEKAKEEIERMKNESKDNHHRHTGCGRACGNVGGTALRREEPPRQRGRHRV